MQKYQFLLLFCKSTEGVPITDVPFYSVDDNTDKSLVVSARGSSLEKIHLEEVFYNTRDMWFVFGEETKNLSVHEFYHFWATLTDEERSQIELNSSSCWHRLCETKLNRLLVLVALPRTADHEADQNKIKRYLSSLPDFVERVSVGSDEVVIDYLMTRYLSEIPEPSIFDKDWADNYEAKLLEAMLQDDYPENEPAEKPPTLGPSDFSYHRNLEHLEPISFWGDDYAEYTYRNDDFYYRFDHTKIEWLREYLRIPYPVEEILTEEQWVQIRELYIEEIENRSQSIREDVFGMEKIKNPGSGYYESLGDYLGFRGPFSDSELGE